MILSPSLFSNEITYSEFSEQQKFIIVDKLKIAYIDSGPLSGPVILLLHGIPTSSWSFRNLIPRLNQAGFRTIAPDLIGFGNSERNKDVNLSVNARAKRMLRLMFQLNIQSWVQLMHDFAGPISWEMLNIEPAKISKLILLNTIITQESWGHQYTKFHQFLVRLGSGKLFDSLFYKKMFPAMFNTPMNENTYNGYFEPMKNDGSYFYRSLLSQIPDIEEKLPFYQEVFQRVALPTLVIWGKKDETLKSEEAKEYFLNKLGLSSSDLHLIEEGNHLIQDENAEFVAQKILEFL